MGQPVFHREERELEKGERDTKGNGGTDDDEHLAPGACAALGGRTQKRVHLAGVFRAESRGGQIQDGQQHRETQRLGREKPGPAVRLKEVSVGRVLRYIEVLLEGGVEAPLVGQHLPGLGRRTFVILSRGEAAVVAFLRFGTGGFRFRDGLALVLKPGLLLVVQRPVQPFQAPGVIGSVLLHGDVLGLFGRRQPDPADHQGRQQTG